MGLLEDISRFLETRLEEFIRANPQMELQVLDDQLRSQEAEVGRLILDFRNQEKKLQEQILAIAEDIKIWYSRAQKATDSKRPDLASAAKEREAALLRQGNQVWGQMELIRNRLSQTVELQSQVHQRREEVKLKIAQNVEANRQNPQAQKSASSSNWNSSTWQNLNPPPAANSDDPLEAQFQRWEMDEELESLKRKMNR
jgi:uncharacterized protein (TIGR04376 family)